MTDERRKLIERLRAQLRPDVEQVQERLEAVLEGPVDDAGGEAEALAELLQNAALVLAEDAGRLSRTVAP